MEGIVPGSSIIFWCSFAYAGNLFVIDPDTEKNGEDSFPGPAGDYFTYS